MVRSSDFSEGMPRLPLRGRGISVFRECFGAFCGFGFLRHWWDLGRIFAGRGDF